MSRKGAPWASDVGPPSEKDHITVWINAAISVLTLGSRKE